MKTLRYPVFGMALLVGATLLTPALPVPAQNEAPVAASKLFVGKLPPNTYRVPNKDVAANILDALKQVMKMAGNNVKQGKVEVLVWTGGNYKKSRAPQIKAQLGAALKDAGWTYEEGEALAGTNGCTMLSAMRTFPSRKGLVGFWAVTDDALALAWTEMLPADAQNGDADDAPQAAPAETPDAADATPTADATEETPDAPEEATPAKRPTKAASAAALPAPAGAVVLQIPDESVTINVMKNAKPKMPTFTAIEPKKGFARGFVKDSNGKPLQGAVIGVAATAVGGAETSAYARTDARGYYEIQVPWGAARFCNAGYAVDWGEGRAALGLAPADGEAEEFASATGTVENFAMLPYGIADRDDLQNNPQYLNNYWGGSVTIEYRDVESMYGVEHSMPLNSTVEITLTPTSPIIDGTQGKTFVVRKTVRSGHPGRMIINNIPIATYRMSGRVIDSGKATRLHFKETGPYQGRTFGLEPKEADNSVTLLFRPSGAKADVVTAAHGHWDQVQADVTR